MSRLVAVVLWLVRAFGCDADIFSLILGQFGQLGADFVEMQAGNFLVQMLRQDVYFVIVFVGGVVLIGVTECAGVWFIVLLRAFVGVSVFVVVVLLFVLVFVVILFTLPSS